MAAKAVKKSSKKSTESTKAGAAARGESVETTMERLLSKLSSGDMTREESESLVGSLAGSDLFDS